MPSFKNPDGRVTDVTRSITVRIEMLRFIRLVDSSSRLHVHDSSVNWRNLADDVMHVCARHVVLIASG